MTRLRPPAAPRPRAPMHAPLPPLPPPGHLMALVQAAALAVLPHGGQRGARRNAWAGMSADVTLGQARRDADRAVELARERADARAGADLRRGAARTG